MSASWQDEEEELKVRGARGLSRPKPRFSFNELKLLLEAVKRNRNVVLSERRAGGGRAGGRSRRLHLASFCLCREVQSRRFVGGEEAEVG